VNRQFVSIIPIKVERGETIFIGAMAVADDGTAWNLLFTNDNEWEWVQILSLPDSEVTT
jgi:hypothetical protein